MKRRQQHESKGALEWIEEATHLLRTCPLGVLACYYIGALPFVLGLLYFWADMSRSPFAKDHIVEAALAMALAYLWMKTWQSVFCLRLRAIVAGEAMEPITLRRCARVFAAQTAIQPAGVLLVPLSLVTIVPFAWVFGFYQNATALAEPGAGEGQSVFKRALHNARFGTNRYLVVLLLLALFAGLIFLNWTVVSLMLPSLLKTLLGIETAFSRSSPFTLLNTTFFATMLGLTYLCADPIVKALHVLRCFRGEAQTTGADLRAELRHVVLAGRQTMLVTFVALLCIASPASENGNPAQVSAPLPHPTPLPLGEGGGIARSLALRASLQQIQPHVNASDGNEFSLSQRERAGVRENAPHTATSPEAPTAPTSAPTVTPVVQPAAVPGHELDRSIEEVINQQKYTWRMPREQAAKPKEQKEDGVITRFFTKLGDKLNEWAKAFWDWLDKLIPDRSARQPKPASKGSGGLNPGFAAGSKLLLYVLLALAIAALIYLGYRLWRNRRRGPEVIEAAPIEVVPDIRDENVTAEQLPEDEWTRLGRELLAKGEFRLAIRAFYLSSLAYLGDRQLITLAKFKSNRDYERELARRSHATGALLPIFGENVVAFDRVWYGLHDVDADAVNHFASNVQKIRATP